MVIQNKQQPKEQIKNIGRCKTMKQTKKYLVVYFICSRTWQATGVQDGRFIFQTNDIKKVVALEEYIGSINDDVVYATIEYRTSQTETALKMERD